MATIKQIAEVCGVSVASVSKALNNASDIGAETAKRIRDTAKEMGYFPNAAARALKTNRSYNIGILFAESGKHGSLIGGLAHEFFTQVIGSFQHEAEANGYDFTFITRNIGGTTMTYLEHCRYRNCDGALVAGVDFSDPYVMELMDSDLPIVTIDHLYSFRSAVLSDNVQCMRDLIRYIYNKGHRKIAFITGQQNVAVTKYRLASFYKTCEELGIDVPDEYIKEATFHEPPASAAATRELLRLSNRPTCILYPDDFAFIGGMNEIEASGLMIPDDISVVGYDGIYLSQVFRPRLTTLKQDTEKLGITAAQMLVQAMKYPKADIPRHVFIPGTVLEGETVKQL
ncbi:MAG TPA: LacI family DNA-binding transcriptional regulator [Clostridia bacterium]|nr:LacI family DNA-binding transcriptional regulator [Clostridia bacterium]